MSNSYAHFDSLIFDLDGTLWNAATGTAAAWTQVFDKHKIPIHVKKEDIESVAGRPYIDCLKTIYPNFGSHPNSDILLKDLALAEKSMMQQLGGEFYPGVAEGLQALSQNIPLFIVSNCQDWYLARFLDFNDMNQFFVDSTCFGTTQLNKSENIKLIMQRNQLKRPIYIGDTEGDEKAANEAHIPYIHVLYGFGKSSAILQFKNFSDLTHHLLALQSNTV